jgi:hypothetical protein
LRLPCRCLYCVFRAPAGSVRYEDYTDFDTNQVALRLYGFQIIKIGLSG